RSKVFNNLQRKHKLRGIIGQRNFFLIPFGCELLPSRIEVDSKNLHIDIPFHELHELGAGHQTGTEQPRRSRGLDLTQETQQTAWEGAEIHDRLWSVRQPLQSTSERNMETISTL